MCRDETIQTGARRLLALACVVAAALVLAGPVPSARAAPGDLDRSFSGDGLQPLSIGDLAIERAAGVATQADGRVVVGVAGGDELTVARYLADGTPDLSFGDGDGVAVSSVPGRTIDVAIVAGGAVIAAGDHFQAARFSASGQPDASYAVGGMADFPPDFGGTASAIAAEPDGSIVLSGDGAIRTVFGLHNTIGDDQGFAVVRRTPDGELDAAFSDDGFDFVSNAVFQMHDVAVAPDRSIVVGTTWNGQLAAVRVLPAGGVDSSYGDSGRAVAGFPERATKGSAVAVQSNGAVVVAGTIGLAGESDFALARFTPAGDLDPTFSEDGVTTQDFDGDNDVAADVAIRGADVTVAGTTGVDGPDPDFALARYTATGEPDDAFTGDGSARTPVGLRDDELGEIALGSDGSVVAAGTAVDPRSLRDDPDVAIARYTPAGDLEPAFGGDGTVVRALGPGEPAGGARAVAVQPDRKVLVAGVADAEATGSDFALERLLPDGTPDPAFGTDGLVTTDFAGGPDAAGAVAVQPDGRIVVAGAAHLGSAGFTPFTDYAFAVARYTADGRLDPTFSGDGMLTTDLGAREGPDLRPGEIITDVAIQEDGSIVVAGPDGDRTAVARYLADGQPDLTFGQVGVVQLPTIAAGAVAYWEDGRVGLALTPIDEIVVAGAAPGNEGFSVARLDSQGGLDPGFAGDGTTTVEFPGGPALAEDVTVQADGRVVVAGAAITRDATTYETYDLAIARLTVGGRLDPSFADDGRLTTAAGTHDDVLTSVAVAPTGSILAGGMSDSSFAIARYTLAGERDRAFGAGGRTLISIGNVDLTAGIAVDRNRRAVLVGDAAPPGYPIVMAFELDDPTEPTEPPTPTPAPTPSPGPSPPIPAAPSPPPAAEPDTTPPGLTLRTRAKWKLGRGLTLRLVCSEACAARISARISGPARARTLAPKRARLAAGRRVKVRLALTRAVASAVRRSLARGRRCSATVTIVATDGAGNRHTRTQTVRVTR